MKNQQFVFLLLLISNFLVGCALFPSVERRPSTTSLVDHNFINNALGKSFEYVRPATSDGEPNCVATALRAGGYTPAFAVNGTDAFYENLLPICFTQKTDNEEPTEGDLGIIYENSVPTLAHMVLFLDQDSVFEKPGPQNDQLFQLNTWSAIIAKEARASADFQVWKYNPQKACPIENLKKKFRDDEKYNEFRAIGEIIDLKIFNQTWKLSSGVKPERLQFLLFQQERKFHRFLKSRGKTFNFKTSYPLMYETLFFMDLVKTLARTPGQ